MVKLDDKDKKILQVLNYEGRASVSEISRRTGIPRDSVYYRLQRLIDQEVIRLFLTVLDPVKLGYPVYTFVFFEFHNCTEDQETKFYAFLDQNPFVNYVAQITGKMDCAISILARDLEHFDEVLRDIRRKFSSIIKDFDTASIIQERKYDDMTGVIKT